MKPIRGKQLTKAHPLTRGLVGCWLFNEGTGNKVFDLSGNGFHGTKGGTIVWEPGKFGSANHYDGSSGYHDFGNPTALQLRTSDFTFLAWVNLDAAPAAWWVIGGRWSDTSSNRSYCLGVGTGVYDQFVFFTQDYVAMGLARSTTTASGKIGKWAQIVGVRKGTDISIYINGIWEANDTIDSGSLRAYNSNFFLGKHTDGWWDGLIDHAMIFNRALSASEIALLYREPFCMFARGWSPELIGGQIVNLAGTSTALSSLGAIAKALRKNAGTAAGASNATAALSSIRGLLPEIKMSWLKEVLFNGMTANAFKLGTILSMGWFWIRVAGCSVLYRGAGMGEINFAKVLVVSERDATEVSAPSYLSHSSGSICFYVIRRFNSCGCQERTLAAAVKVSIESNGELAEPQPNNIFSSKIEHRDSNKIRLVWFYCPLEQKSLPVSFNVYYDDRTGQIDYQNPLATIGYKGRKFYSFQSGELEAGKYLFAIRAEDAEGIENSSLAQLKIQVNTTNPDAIDILSAEGI